MPKWAIWYRRNFHIPRCSNHSEGAHGNINQTLTKHGKYSMKTGFSKIIKYIINYIENRKDTYGEAFLKKHTKIREKIRDILKKKNDEYIQFANSECDCEDDQYNLCIFGVKFPCLHTILNFMNSDDFRQTISKTQIDFHELFLLSFKYFPNTFYQSNNFDMHIDEINQKICSNFCNQFPIYDDETKEIILQLSVVPLRCTNIENFFSIFSENSEKYTIMYHKKVVPLRSYRFLPPSAGSRHCLRFALASLDAR